MKGGVCVVTAGECHVPGDHLKYAREVEVREQDWDSADDVTVQDFFTWRPTGARMFSLMKVRGGRTLAFCHSRGRLFFASPLCMLGRDVEEGTCLLAQLTLDKGDEGTVPRMLVFDLICLGGVYVGHLTARERYSLLLSRVAPVLDVGVCMDGFFRVQWVGEYGCCSAVTRGSLRLPHSVDALYVLRDGDPFRLWLQPIETVPAAPYRGPEACPGPSQ